MIKSTHYKSLKTGNLFSKEEYVNHGFGEDIIWRDKKDLPKDEYPYTIHSEITKPKWDYSDEH